MREWLVNLRRGSGRTLKDVADEIGCSEGYLCLMEAGKRVKKMDLQMIGKIAMAFGESVYELIGKEVEYENRCNKVETR